MFVQLDNAAHYATIIAEMAVPICVAEHDIWSAACAMLIGGVKETAKMRPNLQCVKVVPACLHAPDTRWTFVRVQRYLRNRIGYQTIKAVVAVAQCAPLAPEKNWPAVESPLDSKPGSNFASTKRPASVLTRFRIENENSG